MEGLAEILSQLKTMANNTSELLKSLQTANETMVLNRNELLELEDVIQQSGLTNEMVVRRNGLERDIETQNRQIGALREKLLNGHQEAIRKFVQVQMAISGKLNDVSLLIQGLRLNRAFSEKKNHA